MSIATIIQYLTAAGTWTKDHAATLAGVAAGLALILGGDYVNGVKTLLEAFSLISFGGALVQYRMAQQKLQADQAAMKATIASAPSGLFASKP